MTVKFLQTELFRLLVFFLVFSLTATVASEPERKKERQTKKAQVLSAYAFKPVSEAQKAMEKEDYAQAILILEQLLASGKKLKPYDKAMSYQLLGFIYISKENYQKATVEFERALATTALDETSILNLRYTLAQLYSSMGQYRRSINNLEIWFKQANNPGERAYFLAAQVYALTEDYNKALSFAEQGMTRHEKNAAENPRENWYRLSLAIYLQLSRHSEAIVLLEKMIRLWPGRPDYYRQLAGVNQALGNDRQSLAILALAHHNGLLKSESDIHRLVQLYRYHGYPYKAARILQQEVEANRIAESKKNWEELGNAWMQSREWEKATASLRHAARLSEDGKLWLLLCQTSMQDEKWQRSREECLHAIDKGGLERDEGKVWQLLAVARYESGERNSAVRAFKKCSRFDLTKKQCSAWISHIARQIEKEKNDARELKLAQIELEQRQKKKEQQMRRTLMQRP